MNQIIYLNGQFLPLEEAKLSPLDRGFLFADGIYEVIRAYQGHLFCLDEHMQRLSNGAKAMRYNRTQFDELKDVFAELIKRNDMSDKEATVYLQVTRGEAPRGHAFPPSETPLTVFAMTKPFAYDEHKIQNGIKTVSISDTRWARCDIKTVCLLANSMAFQHAIDHGASEGVLVKDGVLLEGTQSNLFAVRDGVVMTAPKSNYILGGITRDCVLRLCRENNIPCVESPVYQIDLKHLDEMFVTGSTSEVMPVVRMDHHKVGEGVPGPVTKKLQELFKAIRFEW